MSLSKKQRVRKITVNFFDENFYHLVGLHKLTDVNINRAINKKKILNKVINDDGYVDQLQRSKYYSNIEGRIELCKHLYLILSTNDFQIYEYNNRSISYQKTRVRFEYIIKFYYRSQQAYVFLAKNKQGEYHVCNSIFYENTDYCEQARPFNILSKKFIKTNEIANQLTLDLNSNDKK